MRLLWDWSWRWRRRWRWHCARRMCDWSIDARMLMKDLGWVGYRRGVSCGRRLRICGAICKHWWISARCSPRCMCGGRCSPRCMRGGRCSPRCMCGGRCSPRCMRFRCGWRCGGRSCQMNWLRRCHRRVRRWWMRGRNGNLKASNMRLLEKRTARGARGRRVEQLWECDGTSAC